MGSQKQGYFDLRKIIGVLFTFYGLLIGGYGLFAAPDKAHEHINLNLWWGIVILVFGLAFLAVSFWKPISVDQDE
ncbi:hypothetical protein JOD45_001377 [Scopulibacillus daqui]|uniref:Uncharacterized protein n=1 Tax=Scopulibacillus daqui TaxID=1469162 RepID=A0ABS2PYM9_9BACL|nr:hypothetical protein [Scopulibacillus daqui]MBM7645166.1 hypothetical protein [Scopulibacillus daqui]